MAKNPDPNWIEHANLNKGSLTSKAKVAGMGVQSFAKKNQSSPGRLGKQSRLAETLSSLRQKGALK
jgi:coproporphyrinogen III oxidase-like Fe-S oxidoreductase